jgi:hypothetical protein
VAPGSRKPRASGGSNRTGHAAHHGVVILRVSPGDAADSLIFNKLSSKLAGLLAECGSPMPLPATGAPVTQAQLDLVAAWINAGALDN